MKKALSDLAEGLFLLAMVPANRLDIYLGKIQNEVKLNESTVAFAVPLPLSNYQFLILNN